MPLLSRRTAGAMTPAGRSSVSLERAKEIGGHEPGSEAERMQSFRPGLLGTCANPCCSTGWLHLLRSRSTPVFEYGWTCSAECTEARMRAAVRRELGGRSDCVEGHRHRIPLGLLMLEQGWITQNQLRTALDSQRAAGTGRLGYWLQRQGAVNEQKVTRALCMQWSCPTLTADGRDPGALTSVMPRLFVDAFGALPLRLAGERLLYLGFEQALDPALSLAVERMTGLRVESGIVPESRFRPAQKSMLEAGFPQVQLVEAVSESSSAHALAKAVERARPSASRLVRMHDCLWLRMWLRLQHGPLPEPGSVIDLVCSIGAI